MPLVTPIVLSTPIRPQLALRLKMTRQAPIGSAKTLPIDAHPADINIAEECLTFDVVISLVSSARAMSGFPLSQRKN